MNRKLFRILALAVILVAAGMWLSRGANRGWTKTSVPRKTLDEVTGIEGISYEKRFVPGVDFLGAAILIGAVLAGASFLFRKPGSKPETT
jgi:hypothetical protein